MNWSRASRATGVRSFHENGTPVWSGVVNRFDSVMMMVCASPFLPFTCKKPSAPAPPDLLTTMIGRGESLCFSAMPWMSRAIWSARPPVPAETTNSIGLVGSHAAAEVARSVPARSIRSKTLVEICLIAASLEVPETVQRGATVAVRQPEYTTGPDAERPAPHHSTDRLVTASRRYLMFQAACAASRLRHGTAPRISHLSHCQPTLPWKQA